MAKDSTTDNPYPSRPKKRFLTNQHWRKMINVHLRSRCYHSTVRLRSWMEHTYSADHQNIKYFVAKDIHVPTIPITSLLQQTAHKSHHITPFTVHKWQSSLPLVLSGVVWDNGYIRASIVVMVFKSINLNIGGYLTISDFPKANSYLQMG